MQQRCGRVPGCTSYDRPRRCAGFRCASSPWSARGMSLFDNLDLEAATAARLNRWEYLLVAALMRVPNGTRSPGNPVAVF